MVKGVQLATRVFYSVTSAMRNATRKHRGDVISIRASRYAILSACRAERIRISS